MAEADENAETASIEEVEVEFDELIETAGEEGDEEKAEASGHETDAEGLGDEAADNGAASEGPTARNSRENCGDIDVEHMRTTPKETCNEDQTASTEAHDDEEAASEARPQPPYVPERVSASLEGERESPATTDRADDGESKGVVDDPCNTVDDPGGHAESPVARTKHMATPEGGETATNGVVEGIEDVGKRPRKLRNASKRVSERSKRKGQDNSPGRAPDKPDDPGGETAVPGGIHNGQEGPEGVRNRRVDRTNAPTRDTRYRPRRALGGAEGLERRRGRSGPPERSRGRRMLWDKSQDR